ncbi:MAG TPA: hypothetical protein VLH56_19520 [Dissulfurispiraceae bacterium]|nr:hypothetical protein [Dissulfurispiraceae bacterium]
MRVQVYGNNVGGELVLPEAMRSAWGGYVESLDMRVRSYPVIPGTVIYNSRESFGGSHLYAQFTYRQAASVDSIVFTLPGEPVLTISYNAKWDGVNP